MDKIGKSTSVISSNSTRNKYNSLLNWRTMNSDENEIRGEMIENQHTYVYIDLKLQAIKSAHLLCLYDWVGCI